MNFHWFHDWHWAGTLYEVEPKCGPFDPRSSEDRTEEYDHYVCCTCGKTKKEGYWHRYDFMVP